MCFYGDTVKGFEELWSHKSFIVKHYKCAQKSCYSYALLKSATGCIYTHLIYFVLSKVNITA